MLLPQGSRTLKYPWTFAPIWKNDLVAPARLLLPQGPTLPQTGGFWSSRAPAPGWAAPVGGL